MVVSTYWLNIKIGRKLETTVAMRSLSIWSVVFTGSVADCLRPSSLMYSKLFMLSKETWLLHDLVTWTQTWVKKKLLHLHCKYVQLQQINSSCSCQNFTFHFDQWSQCMKYYGRIFFPLKQYRTIICLQIDIYCKTFYGKLV